MLVQSKYSSKLDHFHKVISNKLWAVMILLHQADTITIEDCINQNPSLSSQVSSCSSSTEEIIPHFSFLLQICCEHLTHVYLTFCNIICDLQESASDSRLKNFAQSKVLKFCIFLDALIFCAE